MSLLCKLWVPVVSVPPLQGRGVPLSGCRSLLASGLPAHTAALMPLRLRALVILPLSSGLLVLSLTIHMVKGAFICPLKNALFVWERTCCWLHLRGNSHLRGNVRDGARALALLLSKAASCFEDSGVPICLPPLSILTSPLSGPSWEHPHYI